MFNVTSKAEPTRPAYPISSPVHKKLARLRDTNAAKNEHGAEEPRSIFQTQESMAERQDSKNQFPYDERIREDNKESDIGRRGGRISIRTVSGMTVDNTGSWRG